MQDIINFVKEQSTMWIIIICLGCFVLYSIFAVIINKLYTVKYGKPTIMAWVPIINVFVLGRITIHWLVGIILVIALLFGVIISVNIEGLESIHNLLPEEYVLPYVIAFLVIIVILLIVAKSKYNKIIREGNGKDSMASFINKDYDNKGPAIVGNTNNIPEAKEMISDNFQYNQNNDQNK